MFRLLLSLLLVATTTATYLWVTAPNAAMTKRISRGLHIRVVKPAQENSPVRLEQFEYSLNTSIDNIPKALLDGLVASEDHRFYTRNQWYMVGKFLQAITQCVQQKVLTLGRGSCAGNSTITQQLVKILMVSQHRTPWRKARELFWALKIETQMSKQEILELYANRIYMGSGNYGVGMAARDYFHNSVSNLNIQESVLLAATVQKPNRNPINNPKANRARAQVILDLMKKQGLLSKRITLSSRYRGRRGNRPLVVEPYATHLWFWLKPFVTKQLEKRAPGEYKVWTSMDPEMQIYAQRRLKQSTSRLPTVSQGAVVVMRPDGEVLAMVGGAGDDISSRGTNRAIKTQGLHCPSAASTMKIVVYTAAIEKGLLPDTSIDASPFEQRDSAGNLYNPTNHDGGVYSFVKLWVAFTKSVNTAAVRLLHEKIGFHDFKSTAERLGIPISDIKNELGIALGQSEVCPLDMTTAYATIANNGYRSIPRGIIGIVNRDGKIIFRAKSSAGKREFSANTANVMKDMLKKSVDGKATGYRAASGLPTLSIAGKTGTIDGHTGAWFIGFVHSKSDSEKLVIGIWMGNDNPKPTIGLYGGTAPAEVFNTIVKDLYKHTSYLERG